MACTRAQSTPQIPRRLPQCRFSFARHKNEIPNAPEKGFLGVQFYKYTQFFLRKIHFVGEPRPPIVLLHPDPTTTNRNSAVLVEQVPNGTQMQSPSELSFGFRTE